MSEKNIEMTVVGVAFTALFAAALYFKAGIGVALLVCAVSVFVIGCRRNLND